ncbi:hypothetical protein [Mucilaginibacter pedocola]|uniref:Uncharacterized protein n=1 Tax=Mucilaginibacter pedocola TaxID=1792845 RepID=A0A1S9P7N5_9SPHI|nr:hypothetical protein [Mucilaginibacter pedocola]OOQ56962.1 hypothetical protein BC343_15580 [Mucilaginibacter pedocola]
MSFKLGDFFPKKQINEPYLELADPRWSELEGGYRASGYDASISLRKLEKAANAKEVEEVYRELWEDLHHQGDLGPASYYAVPHMVRIAKENKIVTWDVLGLVSLIEIQRHKDGNPALPKALYPVYSKALSMLQDLVAMILDNDWDTSTISTALTALAIAKGHLKLAEAVQNLDDDDRIEDFLEQYG